MKKAILFFIFYSLVQCVSAKKWMIGNKKLQVVFDDQTTLLTVTDKRCNKIWEQSAYKDVLTVDNTVLKNNTITASFTGKYDFKAIYGLDSSNGLKINIVADSSMAVNDFTFPSSFKTPNKNYYLLETDGDGLLLPVDDNEYPMGTEKPYFCGGGLSMTWMGVTDTAFKTGYMAILETPYDATLNTEKVNGFTTFAPVWMPSMGKFGYDRTVTYHFFDKGGYVAQCKAYRNYIWKKNKVVTLRENEKKTPALAKMIGAPHIYVWDDAREIGFAKDMKAAGIEKAFLLWDANHTPYPEIGYDTKLKELGYAAGVYELFTDLKPRDTATYEVDEHGLMRFALTSYPGKFNQLAARKSDGKTYHNQFGTTSCPIAIRPEMKKRVERELKEYAHEAYFFDVYQANGLFECYAPEHRLTRQQFAEAVNANYKMMAEKYGQYMGGEWGADYLGSNSVFAHGMMTLQRTWFGSDVNKKGTIYWNGDWKNNSRPSQMLGIRTAPGKYLKYSINEYTRVPLYELVYHDAIVTTWRWEDGNHHNPEIWWKKDLFNVLYGTAPLWNLDRERWEGFKNTFVQSYQLVCPWLQKIGYDELVSHRFVTADHQVQESVFSSGKRAVVNFSDKEALFEGKPIKAKSAIFLDK